MGEGSLSHQTPALTRVGGGGRLLEINNWNFEGGGGAQSDG